ncbi:RNA-guided pseudouridylation complex pseudouridine synthase subunit Cbf5 [Methanococcoides sp. SA1]|nr:RNA-guided pseudouridylation complex pseudouridine synthase subunit Cbf5 [Methanococcoides sp. SA1]
MKDIKKLLNFGIVNIDKPAGPTSFSVSEFVKRQLKLKKTSHMGTLDPKVTGVLPVTLGRACKLAGYLISNEKVYVGILETHKDCDMAELQKIIDEKFTGKIKQTPPHRSAVKRAERIREVYHWKLVEASEDKRSFLFEAKVEGGTYIRKLCSDLGEMIGGAHMGELRRTRAGVFSEKIEDRGLKIGGLVRLDEFEAAVLKAKISRGKEGAFIIGGDAGDLAEMIVDARDIIRKILPVIEVDKSAVKSLYIGRPLFSNNVLEKPELKEGDVFAAFSGEVFVGIYRKSGEEIIFGRSEFVCN